MESGVILLAFAAGLALRQVGYPPMLGYLLAGFLASAAGLGSGENLTVIADTGVLLLLFTIGLKLKLRSLSPPRIWGHRADPHGRRRLIDRHCAVACSPTGTPAGAANAGRGTDSGFCTLFFKYRIRDKDF